MVKRRIVIVTPVEENVHLAAIVVEVETATDPTETADAIETVKDQVDDMITTILELESKIPTTQTFTITGPFRSQIRISNQNRFRDQDIRSDNPTITSSVVVPRPHIQNLGNFTSISTQLLFAI